MWDQQKLDAFLHCQSFFCFCRGSKPGVACWRIRCTGQNWDSSTEDPDMWKSPAKMENCLAFLQLTMDVGMSPAESSLRSAEPVSQPTDPWTKTNVYHMPLRLCGYLFTALFEWLLTDTSSKLLSPYIWFKEEIQAQNNSHRQVVLSFFDWLMSYVREGSAAVSPWLWVVGTLVDVSASLWSASGDHCQGAWKRRAPPSIFTWTLVTLIFLFWGKMVWSLDGLYCWKRYHIWDPEGF